MASDLNTWIKQLILDEPSLSEVMRPKMFAWKNLKKLMVNN